VPADVGLLPGVLDPVVLDVLAGKVGRTLGDVLSLRLEPSRRAGKETGVSDAFARHDQAARAGGMARGLTCCEQQRCRAVSWASPCAAPPFAATRECQCPSGARRRRTRASCAWQAGRRAGRRGRSSQHPFARRAHWFTEKGHTCRQPHRRSESSCRACRPRQQRRAC